MKTITLIISVLSTLNSTVKSFGNLGVRTNGKNFSRCLSVKLSQILKPKFLLFISIFLLFPSLDLLAQTTPEINNTVTSITIIEGNTTVVKIDGTSDDGSTLTYSITDGVDSTFFYINPSTGDVTFKDPPDRETPLDYNSDNKYIFEATVTSSFGLSDSKTFTIIVGDYSESLLKITSGGGLDSIGVDAEENSSSVFYTITASDGDRVTIIYSLLNSPDKDKFELNATNGRLNFKAGANYELPSDANHDGKYELLVNVMTDWYDPSITQKITVVVTDKNDKPDFVSNGGVNNVYITIDENSTIVDTIVVVDEDRPMQDLKFQAYNAYDQGFFKYTELSDTTAEISFINAPDFENAKDMNSDNVYQVQNMVFDPDNWSDYQTYYITINNVNDAPVYTVTDNKNPECEEDAGAQIITGWAKDIDDGEAGETQILTFNVSNDNNSLFSVQPAIDSITGDLTFTPAPNANGIAHLMVSLSDDGPGVAPDVNTSSVDTFIITINGIEDLPRFTKGENDTIPEDAGAQSIVGWATNIDDGDPELTQSLSFVISSDNNGLFSVQPAIDPATGTLTYTPKDDACGSATVDVAIYDDKILSASQSFRIIIDSINDAPTFNVNPSDVVNEDCGAHATSNFVTNISRGGGNFESYQTLNFLITNDNNDLFAVQPTIDLVTGTLSYKPNPDSSGVANVDVVLKDNGGLANGGIDSTIHKIFQIIVTPVNDKPVFDIPSKSAIDTVYVQEGDTFVVRIHATDIDGPSAISYQKYAGFDAALFVLDPSTGDLSFNVAPDFENSTDYNSDNNYVILVKANDGSVDSNQKYIIVIVTDINEAPTDIGVTSTAINENQPVGTIVGTLSSTDEDTGDSHTYALVSGTGDADNASFQIVGDKLQTTAMFDYETKNSYSVRIQTTDAGSLTYEEVLTITVNDLNDAPTFTAGLNDIINEDAGARNVSNWATNIDDNDATIQTLIFTVTNNNNSLFSSQPAINSAGELSYTPAANANGTAIVDVVLKDDGGTSYGSVDSTSHVTFTITVNNINDAPSFTQGADQSVNEEASLQTVSTWATFISAGPGDESGQTLAFTVTNDYNDLFAVQPAIDASGTLTYEVADDSTGVATVDVVLKDNGGTLNGGVDSTSHVSFTITVNGINDAPSFTQGGAQSVDEDASLQTVTAWAAFISAGPGNESGQTLAFTVTNDYNDLFSVQPAIDANGTLTYEVADDSTGVATVDVVLKDNGGTTNNGIDSTSHVTFTITVNGINDAPSFTQGTDQSVDEDASLQTVTNWATSMSPGPINEGSQTLTFTVTNDYNGLFAVQPAIDANGTLTYEVAGDSTGVANVDVVLKDNGGTLNGGVDSTSHVSFTITVNGINDAPSFTKGPDQSVLESTGGHTVSGWARDISPGPSDESSQTLSFIVTNNNNDLFIVQPAIDANGELTFEIADDSTGVAIVDVILKDNGGTANGGIDSSVHQTFSISVGNVNNPPSFNMGADQSIDEGEGAQTILNWATAISPGPSNESGQTLTFIVTNDYNDLFAAQPVIDASGTLTYTVANDSVGVATVDVVLKDNGGTLNGGVDSTSQASFTITVNGINDAPSFSSGSDQSVSEKTGAHTVNWATNITKGPSNENSQTLTFILTNDNNDLFSVQPAIDELGILTYTLADTLGVANVDVVLKDNGGTANGGVDSTSHQTFKITVNNVNDAPTDINLTATVVNENQVLGTSIGTLSSTDYDTGDSHSYALVSGIGDSDNASFRIVGNELQTNAVFDFETENTYSVRIRTTDAGTLMFEKIFTITINDINDVPTDILITGNLTEENQALGTAVGILSASDDDPVDSHTYELVSGTGDADNARFQIVGNELQTNAVFDYETKNSYSIRIRTTDAGSLAYEKVFTITIGDINDAPTDITLDNDHVDEGLPGDTYVGLFNTVDPDKADNHSYDLVTGSGDDDNGEFRIVGKVLRTNSKFDSNIQNSYSIRVRSTDNGAGNLSYEKNFIITVNKVNSVPVGITLTQNSINENEPANSEIGLLSTLDPDLADNHTYELLNSGDNAYFDVIGNALVAKESFNYEQNQEYSISVRTVDNNGASFDSTFAIYVNDVNEAPVFMDKDNNPVDIMQYTIEAYDSLIVCPVVYDEDGHSTFYTSMNVVNKHGTIAEEQGNTGCLIFSPDTSYRGAEEVVLIVSDTETPALSDTLTIMIELIEPYINFAPVIVDEEESPVDTLYYFAFVNEPVNICLNAYDANDDIITLTDVTIYEGSAEVEFSQTTDLCFDIFPGADYIGPVNIHATILDNGIPALSDEVEIALFFEPKLEFTQAISPNGDGISDYLYITGIDKFPKNRISIFNRWGDIIYSKSGYDNLTEVWDGQSEGTSLNYAPDGTYFYILDIEGYSKQIKGYLVLKR